MFRSWCKEQGFCNGTNISHVLMDGGVLYVPFDRLNDFYTMYVDCIKRGEKLFVVEQKTDTYNFFLDLDYKDDDELTIEEIEKICRVIYDKVKSFGGNECIVSVAQPKPIGEYIKHGVHINWPNFVVDKAAAVALRTHIVSTMNLTFGSKNWEDIVDLSVYGRKNNRDKGSGFRMPWSHKKEKHEACSGNGCNECGNTGKITKGEYLPIFKYTSRPKTVREDISQAPSVEIMHMVTLRTENTKSVFVEGAKKDEEFEVIDTRDELKDEEVCMLIEKFIQKHMNGYQTACVQRIYNNSGTFVIQTTSKYCQNINKEHNGNHVLFHIKGKFIHQKCFSTHGTCQDFTGRDFLLTPDIISKLYKEDEVPKKSKFKSINQDIEYTDARACIHAFITKYMTAFCREVKEIIPTKKSKKPKHFEVVSDARCQECDTMNMKIYIEKKIIYQECKCPRRRYELNVKSLDKLYPK